MSEATEEVQTWKTDSMSLAAYLSLYFPIVDVLYEEGQRRGSFYWHFDDCQELADAVADFVGGIALVNPREYNDAVAQVKREMFERRNALRSA